MTTRAAQIECLLTPIYDYTTNAIASGYTAYFYSAGTSSAKNVWTEKEKTNPYTSRTLGSDGTVQVYGDGVYKIIIKDGDGTTIYEWDNIKVQANTFTVQSKSGTYTATADDDMILCSGTFTLNLATVTGFTHPLIVKRVSGTITVDPYSTQTIDGNSTITLDASDDSAVLYPDTASSVWRRADSLSGLTSSVTQLNLLDGITSIEDEDDMASNSATSLSTQQSIKAYVDSGTVTMTNKTLTSPVLNTGVSGTAVLDEDNMASDSATKIATQQSIKAYVDGYTSGASAFSGFDLNGNADVSGTLDIGANTTRRVEPTGSFANNSNGNPNISDTLLDVDANVTASQWWAIYPSGSPDEGDVSDKYVWSALGDVPTDADWVEIKFRCSSSESGGTGGADRACGIYVRQNGGSEGNGTDNIVVSYGCTNDADGDSTAYSVVTAKVAIANARSFDIYWVSSFGTNSIELVLVGWGFNP